MLVNKMLCTGCGSCVAACDKKCISMTVNGEGFRSPIIDSEFCVNCHQCENACPLIFPIPLSVDTYAIAAQNKNNHVRENSSSGGIFFELAKLVINNNGIICAARFNTEFGVEHAIETSIDKIQSFLRAKYVQSRAEHCFPEIKKKLIEGTQVLFVGTPCQVAGLRGYLRKDYPNLILVDVICHGVPSPQVWKKYLQERNKIDATDSTITAVNFRSKKTGWSRYGYSVEIEYENGMAYSVQQGKDWYMHGFAGNLFLRNSCSNCNFKGVERMSDMTLGDYWGVWDQHPDFDDNKGTSLLMIHSEKGENVWQEIREKFLNINVDIEEALKFNPSAIQSSLPHQNRNSFFEELNACDRVIELIQNKLNYISDKKSSLFHRIIYKIARGLKRSV